MPFPAPDHKSSDYRVLAARELEGEDEHRFKERLGKLVKPEREKPE